MSAGLVEAGPVTIMQLHGGDRGEVVNGFVRALGGRAPGPRDRGNAITDGMVAAVGGVPGPPGLGGNDHGGFRSQFGQQVFEELVGTAGFEPATP